MTRKEELIKIFEDTKSLVENGTIKTDSYTFKHTCSRGVVPAYTGEEKTVLTIINSDTVTAAQEYSKLGKTAILNMASAKKAGGGVINGARAQEECLFRCSNLFETVLQKEYPLDTRELLYTRKAVFFKDFDYNLIDSFEVDVVTLAAVNLNPEKKPNEYNEYYEYEVANYAKVTRDKIQSLFYVCANEGVDNILLGAWGCGVFKNDPDTMAHLFKEAIIKNDGVFKNIVFPIINDHNSVGNNFEIFKNVLTQS